MNEAETRAELIDPALKAAGWGVIDGSRVRREEVIAQGRLQGAGKRAPKDIADYVLAYKGQKLAVIEAKRRNLPDTEGVGQAKKYSERLQTRFAYSTNGAGIYRIDMETGEEGYVDGYPTPDQLWDQTFAEQNEWRDRFAAVPFEDRSGTWEARYYQHNAINKTLEAIAADQKRILLTMATGTGKTFIAFQLAWKLFQSRWNQSGEPSRRPRILFLADRNILADQAYNAFSSFAEDALVRIAPDEIRKRGQVPKNGSIFFTIFQTFMSGRDEHGNSSPSFGEYPPDFFDFIVIDECHRGGANDESNWRAIMEYFSPAVQLGLTATPRRETNADTYNYFGEPVYVYSLREGINDGYLTPFKVNQVSTTLDEYVYTPDDHVIEGEIEEDKRYKEEDFNLKIEIRERESARVRILMEAIDQNEKTIVFCATQVHALVVRDLINQFKVSTDTNYCVRVTANDGALGEQFLRTFQDNDKTIPTILTTSQKLSTGVDARNIRNIVLMRPINSMIEFKQIIGRGTRLFDGKDYFTIYDFVNAHQHFSDPEWDGEPIDPDPVEPSTGTPTVDVLDDDGKDGGESPLRPETIRIKLADGKERAIQHMMSTTFWHPDGKPMSAQEFMENLFGNLPQFFGNERELRELWSRPDTREHLLNELAEKGFGTEQLAEMRRIINADDSDIFDVLAFVAYALPTLTRTERADLAQDEIHSQFTESQQEFLEFALSQYVQVGVDELSQDKLTPLLRLKYGNSLTDALDDLGPPAQMREIFADFQQYLYLSPGR